MGQPQAKALKLSFDAHQKSWWMAEGSHSAQGPGHYPSIKIDPDQSGVLTFTILNPKGAAFAANNAFVPKPDKPNPSDFRDQLVPTLSSDGRTLTVTDANANKNGGHYAGGDYHYELHFTDGSTLDPIISNGGCCQRRDSSAMILAIGAVVLLALIALAVRAMRNRAADEPVR